MTEADIEQKFAEDVRKHGDADVVGLLIAEAARYGSGAYTLNATFTKQLQTEVLRRLQEQELLIAQLREELGYEHAEWLENQATIEQLEASRDWPMARKLLNRQYGEIKRLKERVNALLLMIRRFTALPRHLLQASDWSGLIEAGESEDE